MDPHVWFGTLDAFPDAIPISFNQARPIACDPPPGFVSFPRNKPGLSFKANVLSIHIKMISKWIEHEKYVFFIHQHVKGTFILCSGDIVLGTV